MQRDRRQRRWQAGHHTPDDKGNLLRGSLARLPSAEYGGSCGSAYLLCCVIPCNTHWRNPSRFPLWLLWSVSWNRWSRRINKYCVVSFCVVICVCVLSKLLIQIRRSSMNASKNVPKVVMNINYNLHKLPFINRLALRLLQVWAFQHLQTF